MSNEELQRLLLEKLGLRFEDLPKPEPPTEEELDRWVAEILDEGKSKNAIEKLLDWPELCIRKIGEALRHPSFVSAIGQKDSLQKSFSPILELLRKSSPDLIVANIDTFSAWDKPYSERCIETAFQHSPNLLIGNFEKYVTEEQLTAIRSALIGIRAAVWKEGGAISREDALYRLCLRICSPSYPNDVKLDKFGDNRSSALFVCQIFGAMAEVDLSQRPYFALDNPHFADIIEWLPSVVSHAEVEVVRAEFVRAVEMWSLDSDTRNICQRFFPLAALKLGAECRIPIQRLLALDETTLPALLRGSLTRALAIVELGRDPMEDVRGALRTDELRSLDSYQLVLPLSRAFDGEVRNGGIFQFLFNSSGNYAYETLQCLRLMNDEPGFGLLDVAISLVKTEVESLTPHEATRKMGTSFFHNKFRDAVAGLEKLYYSQENWELRAYTFVLEHAERYRRH